MVDSNDTDPDRIELAKEELHHLLQDDEMSEAVVLVFANKQDLPNAITAASMIEKLMLNNIRSKWYIQPCCAIDGQGLFEGLEWLANTLYQRR